MAPYFILTSKQSLIFLIWGLALAFSFLFRFWGGAHPDPFQIRPFLIWLLLFGPSLVLAVWIGLLSFNSKEI
tara:strand:- start:1298 stop:1513 length:216 start_codon:yes stop_codon:yes gene_type:complete